MLSFAGAAAEADELYEKLRKRRPLIDQYDRYYEGEQPLKYASKEWAKFHQERYKGFADNWCSVVIDALNERLQVRGFQVGSELTTESRTLWDDWKRNEMDAQSSQGFLQTIGSSRSFVLVWGDDEGLPVYSWEHPGQAYVEYEPEVTRRRRSAIKAWKEDDRECVTLFTRDYVYKLERPSSEPRGQREGYSGVSAIGGWSERSDADWVIPNPIGEVPMVEVPKRPRLNRGPISDISGTMAMQDATNLLWAYLFSAADHASMPARVVMGQEPPKMPIFDNSGKQIGERAVDNDDLQQKRLLWLTGKDASIGQWDSAKLDVFTDIINENINHIAAQTRTPAHYFIANKGMSNINGETLKATETPLVKKGDEFQLYSSPALAEVFRLGSKVRGWDGFADKISSDSIIWADKEIRSESQRADSLIKKKQMGYPMKWLLLQDGNTPEEAEEIMNMIKDEQASDPLFAATEAVRQGVPDESGGVS
ncbi:phage portal protein [Nesterenkonia lacusekhoensis]|uniref:Phage portal protein n=1 Tax=Nesterenkonia lacusekhoensis TaxID=150832 RepID=A0ABS4SYV2_9MICC|nr:hypothetical protein [Nesterenkonia lacusekhoensis]